MKRILILVFMLLGVAAVNAQTVAKVKPGTSQKRFVQKTMPIRRVTRKKTVRKMDVEVVNGERRKKMVSAARKKTPVQEAVKKD